jgi:DNA-binding response OmpR family regulator
VAGEKILDIDDSPTVQRLIEMILTSQGYQVILASDGEEGIAKARSERPSVILVDFVMPKMNGFQVCKTLKEDPDFKDTPIILVTSKGDKVGSKFVDVLGITEYFTKPFQPEELLAKIREAIDKQKPSHAPRPQKEATRETTPVIPYSSPTELEAMIRSIVERAIDEFIQRTLPEMIRKELRKVQYPETTGIQGNLAGFRIVEVLQLLGLQHQTGRLEISRSDENAEIYFKDGMIVFASTNFGSGKNGLEGLLRNTCRIPEEGVRHSSRIAEMNSQPIDRVLAQEKVLDIKTFANCLKRHIESAVYKVMSWSEGTFFFEKATPPLFATPMRLKVDDLLLEGARRADEWTLIHQKIPSFAVVFEPMIGDGKELSARGMSTIDETVFSLINGKRTIQDIVDETCLSEFEVAKSLFILFSANLIRRKQ